MAPHGRSRRSLLTPVERGLHQLIGKLQMGRDRLVGLAPAGGQPVGAGEERDLHRHGRCALQIAVDIPTVERPLVDKEAEHEVVTCEIPDKRGEPRARAQAPAELGDHLLAEPVVADERDPSALAQRVGGRLADVVQERSEPQCLATGQLVRKRLVQCGAQPARGLCLQLDQVLHHLDRVAVDVEVVVMALLDVMQIGQLREHRPQQPQPVGQRQSVQHARREHEPAQLRENPLARRLGHPRRGLRGQPLRVRVGREPELGGEARQPKRPQGIRLVGRHAQHAQHARLEIGATGQRIDQLTLGADGGRPAGEGLRRRVGQRPCHRVDAEVAPGQVVLDAAAVQRRQVVDAPSAPVDHPPGAEGL